MISSQFVGSQMFAVKDKGWKINSFEFSGNFFRMNLLIEILNLLLIFLFTQILHGHLFAWKSTVIVCSTVIVFSLLCSLFLYYFYLIMSQVHVTKMDMLGPLDSLPLSPYILLKTKCFNNEYASAEIKHRHFLIIICSFLCPVWTQNRGRNLIYLTHASSTATLSKQNYC